MTSGKEVAETFMSCLVVEQYGPSGDPSRRKRVLRGARAIAAAKRRQRVRGPRALSPESVIVAEGRHRCDGGRPARCSPAGI